MKEINRRFNSVKEFTDYIDNSPAQSCFVGNERSLEEDRTGWAGTVTFADADEKIKYGDKEIYSRLKAKGIEKISADCKRSATRRTFASSVVGALPNVPAYIAGAPNAMITTRKKQVRQRVVTVGYNTAACGFYDAEDITNRALVLMEALMRIEASGTKVNLYCLNYQKCGDTYISYSIKLKSSGQKFDVLRLCYPLCNPAMNRRHKFRFVEVTEGIPSSFVRTYGYAISDEDKVIEHFNKNGVKLDAAFSVDTLHGKSVEDVIQHILGNGK